MYLIHVNQRVISLSKNLSESYSCTIITIQTFWFTFSFSRSIIHEYPDYFRNHSPKQLNHSTTPRLSTPTGCYEVRLYLSLPADTFLNRRHHSISSFSMSQSATTSHLASIIVSINSRLSRKNRIQTCVIWANMPKRDWSKQWRLSAVRIISREMDFIHRKKLGKNVCLWNLWLVCLQQSLWWFNEPAVSLDCVITTNTTNSLPRNFFN